MTDKTFKIFETIGDTFSGVFCHLKSWAKVISAPLVMMVLAFLLLFGGLLAAGLSFERLSADEAALDSISDGQTAAMGIGFILAAFPFIAGYTMLSINAFRFAALGELPAGYLSFSWGNRHWKMIGYSFLVVLLFAVAMGLAALPFVVLGETTLSLVVGGVVLLATVYAFMRLYLFAPAVAVGEGNPLKDSWEKTKCWNWLKVFVVVFIVSLIVNIASIIFIAILGLIGSEGFIMGSLFIIGQILLSLASTLLPMQALGLMYKKLD